MKVLVLHGSLESRPQSTERAVTDYLMQAAREKGLEPVLFSLSEARIPLFDPTAASVPDVVLSMCQVFKEADLHIWFTPLYHGSMTGALKNALDWVELTRKAPNPYLTGKVVGLTCVSDGLQAMQGVNAMDAVAKALRAWVLPFSVPAIKSGLFEKDGFTLTDFYKAKFDQLLSMLAASKSILSSANG